MRTPRIALVAVFLATLGTGLVSHAQGQTASVPYWHLWTGHDRKSHLTKCTMTSFVKTGGGQQWQTKQSDNAAVILAYNPKGDWHENPKVQWVTVLQGAFFLKAQDGSEVTLPPGALLLGEDLNTLPDAEGHRGHVSANRGGEPIVLLIVQLTTQPKVGEPCHVK